MKKNIYIVAILSFAFLHISQMYAPVLRTEIPAEYAKIIIDIQYIENKIQNIKKYIDKLQKENKKLNNKIENLKKRKKSTRLG